MAEPPSDTFNFYISDWNDAPDSATLFCVHAFSQRLTEKYTFDSLVRAFRDSEQIRANIRGDAAPKHNPASQADRLQQKPVQSPQPSSPQEEQGFAGGGGITWPEYRAAHMDLPVREALRRFRALKRGQNPNTMTGGMHM